MDGDLAELKELEQRLKKYEAKLLIDEAHSLGVFGYQGRGLVFEHLLNKNENINS